MCLGKITFCWNICASIGMWIPAIWGWWKLVNTPPRDKNTVFREGSTHTIIAVKKTVCVTNVFSMTFPSKGLWKRLVGTYSLLLARFIWYFKFIMSYPLYTEPWTRISSRDDLPALVGRFLVASQRSLLLVSQGQELHGDVKVLATNMRWRKPALSPHS